MARTAIVKQKGGCRCRFRLRVACVYAITTEIKVIFRPYHTARTVINKTQRLLAHTYVIITKWLFDMPENNKAYPGSSFADIDMNVMKISATGGKDRQHSIHHITNNAPVNPKASADWRHLCLRWRNKYCKLAIWQIACASFDTIIQSSSSSPRGSSGNVTHFVGTATITTCTSEPIWQGSGHVASLNVTMMRYVRVIY